MSGREQWRALESFDELCDGVDRFRHISYDRRMTTKELRTIAELLKFNRTVEVFYMEQNFLDEDGSVSAVITEGLEQNETLRKFWFERNGIEDTGAQRFATVLRANEVLTELYLRHNNIGKEGASAIASALETNETLETLSMRGNPIGDDGAGAFAQMLRVNNGLKTLSLSETSMGDNGARAIADALMENSSLEEITLEANQIGVHGMESFFKGLKRNSVLRTVTLSANSTGPIAPEVMMDVFKHNHCMRYLEFDKNELGDAGAVALSRGLRVSKTLSYINLEGNNIREEGAVALASALTFNTSIEILLLRKNRVGDKGVSAIADALRTNNTLLNLRLSGNEITDIGAMALASALHENSKLSQLSLSDNEIGHEGGKALCKMLWVNRSLIHLSISGNHLAMPYDEDLLRSLYEQVARRNRHLQRDVYSQTLESGQTSPWQRGKLILLGPNNAGKSTLLARLVDEYVQELGILFTQSGSITGPAARSRSISGNDDENEENLAIFDVTVSPENRWSLCSHDAVAENVVNRTAVLNFEQSLGQDFEHNKLIRTSSTSLGRKSSVSKGLPPRMPSTQFNKAARTQRHPGARPGYDEIGFSRARNEQGNIGLSIVDLSGNAHIRHLLFSPRALYMLAFSLPNFDAANLKFWLNTVRFHCPEASFILVGTDLDELDDPGHAAMQLRTISDTVKTCLKDCSAAVARNDGMSLAFFPVDVKSKRGVEALRDGLLRWLHSCKSVSSVVSIPWMLCLHALLKLAKPWVALGQVKDIASSCGVASQAELDTMVNELHALGVLLNLKETENLRSMVVLNPKWLIDSISRVLRVDLLTSGDLESIHSAGLGNDLLDLKHNAMASLDILQYFWGKKQLTFLCDLMRSIFLLAEWDIDSTERRFIVPSIVRSAPKLNPIDRSEDALRLQFTFAFLPNGLFERFMCLCIDYSANAKTKTASAPPVVARDGAQFRFGSDLLVVLGRTGYTFTAYLTEEEGTHAAAKALQVLLAMITKLGDEVAAKSMFQYKAFVESKTGKMIPLDKARTKKLAPWFHTKHHPRRTRLHLDAIAKFL